MPTTTDHAIAVASGDIPAILCTPDSGSGPGVVLIQEIFGINDYILSVAERLANEGHAFDNDKNPMFANPSAAAASWARTSEFLRTHLNA